ncbi:L-threonine 3-dehydrogenase [Paenibacillus chitinolyticus]|uniref:L-threonine 3-dehydrogenase n=1 Tax=Paenibacillus chitinolyticus TaxID=79263 RepID=A0A410WT07_9BACL|nr:L-threonine 3-dehydrogenase [Paenibacillus chitinolyticus]MCY9588717.1 L-threonine 3-dehydrogenase [Paenibacillus chitinolyticus]MCY9595779.1 L-threonine 3-dehydrogenase [Paenibacillus chitinolyticus]QAV17529.1 L-threonine 3-dehydrogenase [Paenibacillus chitinolyticus]
MTQTMVGLVKAHRRAGAVLMEVPVPECGPDEVLIRVKASSICGTDMHIYQWDDWAEQHVVTPNVFGHEFAGVVHEVGSQVSRVRVGDYVSAEGHIVCGMCKQCRSGNAHVCPHTRSFGITAPGCFADYAVTKAVNIIPNDKSLPFELACLQDPLGNAVQSVLSGDIVGKSVVVMGVGPIGLMAVQVAKAAGAGKIIAVDLNAYRLDMARKLGADATILSSPAVSAPDLIREMTGGEGAEVGLEMSGNARAINDLLEAMSPGGRVSLLGIPAHSVPIDLSRHVIFKGLQVHGITGRRMYNTWHQIKGLLDQNRIDLQPLVQHTFTLDRYEEAFDLMASGQCAKVVFTHI